MLKLERKNIAVKKSEIHGWGVFAEQDIFPGDLIEACHYVSAELKYDIFGDYSFAVRTKNAGSDVDYDLCALSFGYGSIYNHSDTPNASYVVDHPSSIIYFHALRPIIRGEEIFIYYGDKWFAGRGVEPVKTPSFSPIPMRYRIKKFFRDYKNILRMCAGTAAIMSSIALLHIFYRLAL